MRRRSFNALLAGAVGAAALSRVVGPAAQGTRRVQADFYANVGPRLHRYRVDEARGSLEEIGNPVALPEEIQEAWQWGRYLYVASSDEHTAEMPSNHYVNAFEVDSTGGLEPVGDAVRLRHRPIYITVDYEGRYLLAAFNNPSGIAVHRLNGDGTVGDELRQQAALDAGVYAHQVRMMPSGRAVIVPARGNQAIPGERAEDRGALKIYDFRDGQLTNGQDVAPDYGRDFRCRHVEFHPSGRWVYVVLEAQNELLTFGVENDRLSPEPLHVTRLLASSTQPRPGQAASAIRMHPSNGRTLYVANRGLGTESFRGEQVISEEMENSIAVLSIEPETGEPTLIQSADPQSIDVRMFAMHPNGRWLVATSHERDVPIKRRSGDSIETVPPRVVLFSVDADGRLTLRDRFDVRTDGMYQLWCGAVEYQTIAGAAAVPRAAPHSLTGARLLAKSGTGPNAKT